MSDGQREEEVEEFEEFEFAEDALLVGVWQTSGQASLHVASAFLHAVTQGVLPHCPLVQQATAQS